MKEFYIGFVLFVIIAGMLYLFEPDYIKKPDINHENKIQYDKLILLSMIISLFLTVIICMVMSYDNKNMKKKSVIVEGDNKGDDVTTVTDTATDTATTDITADTDVPSETNILSPNRIKTYDSNKYKPINPNIASIYNT